MEAISNPLIKPQTPYGLGFTLGPVLLTTNLPLALSQVVYVEAISNPLIQVPECK